MALGQTESRVDVEWDSSVVMDGVKQSPTGGKKVRFDLNDEIFLIPSKWDRLSTKTAVVREKFVGELSIRNRVRSVDERRAKCKQNKNKKVKRSSRTRKIDIDSAAVITRKSSGVNSEKYKVAESPGSKGSTQDNNSAERKPKTTEKSNSIDIKLRLSHREQRERAQVDIVLPKIAYTTDLKRAIEKALVRNRTSSLDISNTKNALERTKDSGNSVFRNTRSRSFSETSLSSLSSSETSGKESKPIASSGAVVSLPNGDAKFSELSRNIDSWTPFPAGWKDNGVKQDGKRNTGPLIPHSILY